MRLGRFAFIYRRAFDPSDLNRMNYPLERLSRCADAGDIKHELRALCSRFGAIMRLDVLMANLPGRRQAICMWRMESPEREEELMSEFGVGRFGGDLVMVVDLEPQSEAGKASSDGARRARVRGASGGTFQSPDEPFHE